MVVDALSTVASNRGALRCEPATVLPRYAPMSALTAAALVRSADGTASNISSQLLHLIGEEGLIALSPLAEVLRREEIEMRVLTERRNVALAKARPRAALPPASGAGTATTGDSSPVKSEGADGTTGAGNRSGAGEDAMFGDAAISDALVSADAASGQSAAVFLDHEGTLVQLPVDLTTPFARYCGR